MDKEPIISANDQIIFIEKARKAPYFKATEKVSSEKGLAFSYAKKYNREDERRWENAEGIWSDHDGIIALSGSL